MISVIVPVYMVEDYLERCIESLIHQDYDWDYEIILVDDGSKDRCGEICDLYSEKYEKIFAYHKENGGLSSARNYGVSKAKGDWVSFVDSDDYVSSTYLKDMVQLANSYNADMVITNVVLRSEEHALIKHENSFSPFSLKSKDAFLETYVKNNVGWSSCGKLIKTEVVKKNPFPNGYYEEMASTYLFIAQSSIVAFGDFSDNYHYLRRVGSITASPINEKHFRIFEICKEIDGYINRNFEDKSYVSVYLYEKAVLQLLNRTILTNKQFKEVFCKYRRMFRKNMFSLLFKNDICKKSKYYAVVLSTTPFIYKMQRMIFKCVKGGD